MTTQRLRIAVWKWFYCPNCENIVQLYIPVGTKEYNLICPYCKTYLETPPHRICEKYPHEELNTPFCVTECKHYCQGKCIHPYDRMEGKYNEECWDD